MTESNAKMADGAYWAACMYLEPEVRQILDDTKRWGSKGSILQMCHDVADDAGEVIANLIGFAEVYNLKLPKELK